MSLPFSTKVFAGLLGSLCLQTSLLASGSDKPNILFIISDDLNYIDIEPTHTPNLDKLLAVSTEFRGYANFPWCNASRTSFLSGLRPEALGVYDTVPKPAQAFPDRYWMPMGINDAGYHTVGVGKIGHRGSSGYNVPGWDTFRYPVDSDPPLSTATVIPYFEGKVAYWEDSVQLRDEVYRDVALELIAEAQEQSDPWFVAVGFKKPHEFWYSHKSDWESNGFLNPDGTANLDAMTDPDLDPMLAPKNYHSWPRFNPRTDLENAKLFRMGYRACITHIDELVGDVLEAVDTDLEDPELNLPPDLVVIFTSDHGHGTYQLGARVFSKVNPHEAANRIPFWIHLPGQESHQDRSDILFELVDLYPTVLDLVDNGKLSAGELMAHGQSAIPPLETGDWSGWNNTATTVVMNRGRGYRYQRVATRELVGYHQLWNNRGALFSNEDLTWINPETELETFFPADPDHWCNISVDPAHPLKQELMQHFPADPLAQALDLAKTSSTEVQIEFFGETGLRYTISSSQDLHSWLELETVEGAGALITRSFPMEETQFFRSNLWIDPLVDFSFQK